MFVTRPINGAGLPGEKLTLTCEVDANPRPSYKWYKMPDNDDDATGGMLVGTSSNLTIEVNATTAGRYECVASAKGGHYAAVKSQANIFVKSKPDISFENRVQKAPMGGTGHVECLATSVPTVQSVEWSFRDEVIALPSDGGSGRYSVQENRSMEGVRQSGVLT